MKRERFGSRIGFLLVSAGCAIGIGNVWRFPYITGQYGGGVFVLFYLLFLLLMGAPVLMMELAVGRAGHGSAMQAYRALEPRRSVWHIHGWICMAGCYLLMMYYTTVSGWMLGYFVKFLTGVFDGLTDDAVGGVFGAMLGNPGEMVFWMAITVAAGFLVVSFGLQKGLERITKVMMSALLVLIVVLALHSVLLPGAAEGLKFFLVPDWERAVQSGLGNVLTAAMNQAFFTLSLGIGAMLIFGSYLDRRHSLLGESVRIAGLDTFVAFTSGLIIFPACMAYNVPADSGPNLIFITLPNVFNDMPAGRVWGSLFFLFMSFAAFSTIIAVFENILACTMDLTGWTRKKAALVNGVVVTLISLPCVLGFNVWSAFDPRGNGSGFMDVEDYLISNILLPFGSLVYLFFCISRVGWGFKKYQNEANQGEGAKIPDWMRVYVTYILPIFVAFLFIQSVLAW